MTSPEQEARDVARHLMFEHGHTLSGERLETVLMLAWLLGGKHELEAALDKLR
jgi:hypothetical protein